MNQRPEIKYPCDWSYKLIGTDLKDLRAAVGEILPAGDYKLTHSRTSEEGKYFSMDLRITVYDHATREGLYRALSTHESIRLVL